MEFSNILMEEYMRDNGIKVNKMEMVNIQQLMDCKEKEHGNKVS